MTVVSKAGETVDIFLNGRLKIVQSQRGYRFSVDALLLADFVLTGDEDMVADLGAGCGIISLFLAVKKKPRFIVGLELQDELVSQARRNVALNKLAEKVAIIQGDLRHLPLSTGFADIVVCNPPYRTAQSGRINPDVGKAIARHEIEVSLDAVLAASKALLKRKGRLALIYPANRMAEIFTKMRRERLEPKRLQIIFPDSASEAKLALIEGRLQARPGLKILPPIFGQGDDSL
ncbi:MAG TPA: methyltransferase, partial [Desulfatiglandales bacterium]|nr:methyltransferase [Desulfatiglandales bacterium]